MQYGSAAVGVQAGVGHWGVGVGTHVVGSNVGVGDDGGGDGGSVGEGGGGAGDGGVGGSGGGFVGGCGPQPASVALTPIPTISNNSNQYPYFRRFFLPLKATITASGASSHSAGFCSGAYGFSVEGSQ